MDVFFLHLTPVQPTSGSASSLRQRPLVSPSSEDKGDTRPQQQQQSLVNTPLNTNDPFSPGESVC